MDKSKLRVESYDPGNKVIKIIPAESFDYNHDAELMWQTILNLTKIKQIQLILDLKFVLYPTTSFIAFIIEVYSKLKRQGGELYIINVSEKTRMNFVTFSSLNFLNVVEDEEKLKEKLKNSRKNKNLGTEIIARDELKKNVSSLDEKLTQENFAIKDRLSKPDKPDQIQQEKIARPADFDFSEIISEEPEKINEIKSEKIVVLSRDDQLYKLTDFVTIHSEKAGFAHTEISRIKISVYEAAHNIIEHAYEFNSDKYIELNLKYDQKKLSIYLMDKGKAFEYDPDTDYSAVDAAEKRRTGGFGLHIIRRSMDDVQYECSPIGGNRLIIVKNIP